MGLQRDRSWGTDRQTFVFELLFFSIKMYVNAEALHGQIDTQQQVKEGHFPRKHDTSFAL